MRTRWSSTRRDGHHGEVGHHVVLAQKGAEGLHQVGDLPGPQGDRVSVGAFGLLAPLPGVLEGADLGGGLRRRSFRGRGRCSAGVGVEGRVEVDRGQPCRPGCAGPGEFRGCRRSKAGSSRCPWAWRQISVLAAGREEKSWAERNGAWDAPYSLPKLELWGNRRSQAGAWVREEGGRNAALSRPTALGRARRPPHHWCAVRTLQLIGGGDIYAPAQAKACGYIFSSTGEGRTQGSPLRADQAGKPVPPPQASPAASFSRALRSRP